MNLSRGGILLAGNRLLKAQLYRRKSQYTNRPVAASVDLFLPGVDVPVVIEGSAIYLRHLGGDEFQVGFKFLQEQSQPWLDSVLASCGPVTGDRRVATGFV